MPAFLVTFIGLGPIGLLTVVITFARFRCVELKGLLYGSASCNIHAQIDLYFTIFGLGIRWNRWYCMSVRRVSCWGSRCAVLSFIMDFEFFTAGAAQSFYY